MVTESAGAERNELAQIIALLSAVDERQRLFGEEAGRFGDPSWYMLLTLYVASKSHEKVNMMACAAASRAPTSSGLRQLRAMIASGLVEQEQDRGDARRTFVVLTDRATALIEAWLAETGTPR